MMSEQPESAAEQSLRATWSIGPLRPWLKMLAERQLPTALRGRVDPSDIVQQALIDAWRGREAFRGDTHAERLAWLRVILTRAIMRSDRDMLRTAKRGQGREKTLQSAIDRDSVRIEQLATGREPGPASQADQAEQTLLVAAALDALSPEYQQVLVLRHFEGLAHAEIASQIGRSEAATRMLWVRALQALKKHYEPGTDDTTHP